MQAKRVDFTRSIYTVSGSNLAFESKEMVWDYIRKKWGVRDDEIQSFAFGVGTFESGAHVETINVNGQEVKILARQVCTKENLDAAVDQGW
jgi:hypothetical protein